MCDEYIYNDTDAGRVAVAQEYFRCPRNVWRPSGIGGWSNIHGHGALRTILCDCPGSYRIKNPDYVKKPVKGEIWTNDFGCFATYNGKMFVFRDGSCFQLREMQKGGWKFTGQTTDMYEKIDALEKIKAFEKVDALVGVRA